MLVVQLPRIQVHLKLVLGAAAPALLDGEGAGASEAIVVVILIILITIKPPVDLYPLLREIPAAVLAVEGALLVAEDVEAGARGVAVVPVELVARKATKDEILSLTLAL